MNGMVNEVSNQLNDEIAQSAYPATGEHGNSLMAHPNQEPLDLQKSKSTDDTAL